MRSPWQETEEQKDGEPTQTAKDTSTERIDGIVATIMAIGRALVAQEEPQPAYSIFFV